MMSGCCPSPSGEVRVFPLAKFLSEFPQFADADNFSETTVARCGNAAMHYITEWRCGFPLEDPNDREYALFLMTAHILSLRKSIDEDMAGGQTPAGGRVKKATVGAVIVETDAPNSYNSDDYTFWLSQTAFGQELLAYLANSAPAGIYMNCMRDSVRVV